MRKIKGDVFDAVLRKVEQDAADKQQRMANNDWTYEVDQAGWYELKHRGVLKGRGRHAAVVAKNTADNAAQRVKDFQASLAAKANAAARLRRFELESRLNEGL